MELTEVDDAWVILDKHYPDTNPEYVRRYSGAEHIHANIVEGIHLEVSFEEDHWEVRAIEGGTHSENNNLISYVITDTLDEAELLNALKESMEDYV